MSLLKVSNLNFKYSDEKVLFNDAYFELNKGEIVCLIGVNGSGKTTLLKMLSNIIVTNLKIDFFEKKNVLIEQCIGKIGYIPDKPFLYDYLTGYENIEYIGSVFKEKKDYKDRVVEMCKKLKLECDLSKEVRSYSLGMKHKLFLSIILSRDVDFILMDEPLTSLDVESVNIVQNIIRNLCNNGLTVFLSTHIKQIIDELSDRILCIENQKVIECKDNKYSEVILDEA